MTREELREKVARAMFLHKATDAALDAAIRALNSPNNFSEEKT